MLCNRLEKVSEIHNIEFNTMGSFCDFQPGRSPEGSNSVDFLEDGKTYVIMEDRSNYHHFLINLMMPALTAIDELNNEELHFVLCDLGALPEDQNFEGLLVELLQEKGINYTELKSSDFDYINAKNFIPINGADVQAGIPLLYNYLLDKYNLIEEAPSKKIYISRKNFVSNDVRIDDEEAIENYFIEKGFEIVYTEEIATFKEQFELLNSCSAIAALTGSGLTGLLFMQENQEVIEIVSELLVGEIIADDGTKIPEYGIHDHYREFSIMKNLSYSSVLNLEKEAALVKERLDDLIFSSQQSS
jgi:capsular polysaccharide biosynthesis protein